MGGGGGKEEVYDDLEHLLNCEELKSNEDITSKYWEAFGTDTLKRHTSYIKKNISLFFNNLHRSRTKV